MTVLRLEAVSGRDLDRALAVVGSATLTRRAGACYVDVALGDVVKLTRALAFGGIAARPTDTDLSVPAGLIPAVGCDLEPIPTDLATADVVRVRRVGLGEATAEILRRRLAAFRAPSAQARARCRGLLRGEEVLFAWGRRAWGSREALRAASVRSTLRPAVFDRTAIDRDDRPGRSFVSDGALARWAFG